MHTRMDAAAHTHHRLVGEVRRVLTVTASHTKFRTLPSIPSNVAEGFGRHHTAEYIHHLWYANGSNNELQTQLELGHRVKIVTVDEATALIADAEEIGRMLYGLIGSLQRAHG